ncbi:diguanylate cyclase [Falsiroseomonas sp.]|uniref:GGDEF domain-containing protein n=1 Tax=Falsiroseomonas sp. TaxID=2870721 RepID=UPI002733017D|nr:sensor domain-containing diguanylate cyclase [Falsiroseomonas sp.]MDP3419031.1 sensor domain-containing diguanylate cyclase [Falsiroseomonas sp.]
MDGPPPLSPPSPDLPPGHAAREPLASALLDSRARWRDFALLSADLLFETDAEGRFTFLAPETVLGHPAESLIGAPAVTLFAGPGPGVFGIGAFRRQRMTKAWLECADGSTACLEFTLLRHGEGLRGSARDVTAAERRSEVVARALRRANALGRLLRLGQRQGGAEAALGAMLAALPAALNCQGAALLVPEGESWRAAHVVNHPPPLHLLPPPGTLAPGSLATGSLATGSLAGTPHHAVACTEAGPCLLAWRDPQEPPLDSDDRELLAALALPMAALKGEVLRQKALTAAADGDPLTGLLNRRGFTAALERQVAAGGALVFLDLDGLKPLNDRLGHEAGDAALRAMGARLRAAAAREDLAARLGGDEFCLWLHGASQLEAECRIGTLGAPGPLPEWPEAGPAALRASLGVAMARSGEPVAELLARADAAMYAAKRALGDRRK